MKLSMTLIFLVFSNSVPFFRGDRFIKKAYFKRSFLKKNVLKDVFLLKLLPQTNGKDLEKIKITKL